MLKQRLQTYGRLMRIDRPIGTWLVAWPMLWSLWLASGGHPDASLVLIFLAGAFVMRSAGCVINDFADRKVDPHVERTKQRPMAAGEISAKEALALFAVLCLVAFGLVLCTNRLTIELSFAGVALAAVYPFMKRYTHWPQVFLGAAFGWAVPMAFAAQTNAVPPEAWMVFAADICWVMAYDTMYAMVDRDDDLKIGVKSTAILFGRWDRLIIGLFQIAFIALLVAVGLHYALGVAYYAGLGVATALAVYHQRLIFRRRREDCFRAFLNNNLLGAAVFLGLVIDFIL